MSQQIGIASDHGGRLLKEKILRFLEAQKWDVKDFGVSPAQSESVDYPDYAAPLARAVSHGQLPLGVLICGSGIGMSIAANRFPGIRAALVTDEYTARMSKQHNNSNVICLGERVVNHDRALELLKIWLETPFENGRHQRRLDKIHEIEKSLGCKAP